MDLARFLLLALIPFYRIRRVYMGNAEKVKALKDGVILEQGSHEELLALNGTYRELYETQFRQILDYEAEHQEEGAKT